MTRRLGIVLLLALAVPAAASQPAVPIPGPLDGPLPRFEGGPAVARPLKGPFPPHNAALARDGASGSGLAAGNGGASPFAGPLGYLTDRASATEAGSCASLAFDPKGRLLALCNGPALPALRLIDPATLDTLAALTLPARRSSDTGDLAGGTHFVQRADGSMLVPTNDGTLLTVVVQGDSLVQKSSLSLTGLLAGGERPFAVDAGFDGRDWLVGDHGTVVTLPRDGSKPQTLALKEPVAEDLATDPSGTYVVTGQALYRLRADASGKPHVVWRERIPGGPAPAHGGRLHDGPGTPPAIVPGGYVAVADGNDPPRLLVMRRSGRAARRLACSVPLFTPGHGSVEAQLVVAGHAIVASNAYGYDTPLSTEDGKTTLGGISQVLVGPRGCRTRWRSKVISPSAQPVVSRATGLLYTLDKPAGFPDRWDLAALDWRTGKVRFRALAGEGLGFNSNGGAVALAPNGSAFAGTFGGVVRFSDVGGPNG
ncbi:MAG: hypothetical protein JWM71_1384 [Solirubrobacteraceae bacterium]|nr:hypothetical protein [Solirubrobacteraceae bacterium]